MDFIFVVSFPLLSICLGLLSVIHPEKIWSFNKKLTDLLGVDPKEFYLEGLDFFGFNKNRESQIKFIKFIGWLFVLNGLFLFALLLSPLVTIIAKA